MYENIKTFVITLLEKKGPIPTNQSVDDYAFLDNGHIDSIALIQFIVLLEQKYDIEISEEEIISQSFRTVSGLTNIIFDKVSNNNLNLVNNFKSG